MDISFQSVLFAIAQCCCEPVTALPAVVLHLAAKALLWTYVMSNLSTPNSITPVSNCKVGNQLGMLRGNCSTSTYHICINLLRKPPQKKSKINNLIIIIFFSQAYP